MDSQQELSRAALFADLIESGTPLNKIDPEQLADTLRAAAATSKEGAGYLSQDSVRDLIGWPSRQTLLNWEKRGTFPRRVYLSPRRVAWRKAEVLDYLEDPEGWRERHRGDRA